MEISRNIAFHPWPKDLRERIATYGRCVKIGWLGALPLDTVLGTLRDIKRPWFSGGSIRVAIPNQGGERDSCLCIL